MNVREYIELFLYILKINCRIFIKRFILEPKQILNGTPRKNQYIICG